MTTTTYRDMDYNCDYETFNKDHVGRLPCQHVVKEHEWLLKYLPAYSLNKDPSTLAIKEGHIEVSTHFYGLKSLIMP